MRNPVSRAALLTAAAMAAFTMAAPAAAQTLPNLDNFTLERAPPAPSPTAAATPVLNTVTASPPTVRPTATPRATPSPTPSRASPSPTPRVTPSASPSPTATPSASPAAAPSMTPTPVASSSPTPVASTPPVATPVPIGESAPAEPAPAGTSAWWVAAIVGALAALALALAAWWRSRRRDETEAFEDFVEPEPEREPEPAVPAPAPAPVAPVVAPAAARPAVPGGLITTALRPAFDFALVPHNAGIDTLRATLQFTLTLRNTGRAPAYDVAVETWLFSVGTDPAGVLDELAALAPSAPLLDPFVLPATAAIDVPGQGAVDRDGLAVLTAGERKLFVPMLGVRATGRDGGGAPLLATAGFMIGVERAGQERLAPLALDRGARGYAQLGVRRFLG